MLWLGSNLRLLGRYHPLVLSDRSQTLFGAYQLLKAAMPKKLSLEGDSSVWFAVIYRIREIDRNPI